MQCSCEQNMNMPKKALSSGRCVPRQPPMQSQRSTLLFLSLTPVCQSTCACTRLHVAIGVLTAGSCVWIQTHCKQTPLTVDYWWHFSSRQNVRTQQDAENMTRRCVCSILLAPRVRPELCRGYSSHDNKRCVERARVYQFLQYGA